MDYPDWNDLRYFLQVARTGKLSDAAERLKVESSTVSRRLDRLEDHLGAKLFDRRRDGYALTETGEALIAHAEAMEAAVVGAIAESSPGFKSAVGKVRIGSPEAFGTCVLTPRLSKLYGQHPDLHVELMAQPQFPSLATREVDLLVTLEQPQTGRYVVVRLAEMQYQLFGCREYLEGHPPINELKDLVNHQFVDWIHEGKISEHLRYLSELTPNPRSVFSSNSVHAQRGAAASGLGLILLTPYAAADYPNLVRIFPGEPLFTRTLWLAAPQDLFRLRRIRVAWDFIREIVEQEPELFSFVPQSADSHRRNGIQ